MERIRGHVAIGLDAFGVGNEQCPLQVEPLTHNDDFVLIEYAFCPDHAVQGPETGMVVDDGGIGHAPFHQFAAHGLGLIVIVFAVVAAHDDLLHLPGMVEPRSGFDALEEEDIGTRGGVAACPQKQGHLCIRDLGDIVIDPGIRLPDDPDIDQHDGHNAPESRENAIFQYAFPVIAEKFHPPANLYL